MENKHIYAVLLAGGRGKRLWPVSKPTFSKSFIGLKGYKPPILNTIEVIKPLCAKNNIFVVTTADQRRHVRILKKIPPKNIIVEPYSRNTAAAIGLAALHLVKKDASARMVVLPTDQHIKGKKAFLSALVKAIKFINKYKDSLIVLGIKPDYPSTSFGYIKTSDKKIEELYSVKCFFEKPSLEKAKRFVRNRNFLWNAGIFVWRADTLLNSLKIYAPRLFKNLQRMRGNIKKVYKNLKDISIDYELLEKARNLYCVGARFDMCDIGSWISLKRLYQEDKSGNILVGDAEIINSSDSIVYNTEKHKIGLVGAKDMIVVHDKRGTLVCHKQSAEKVKDLKQ